MPHQYSAIIVDCPPGLGFLTINALTNANIEIADPTQGFFINGVEIPSDENRNEIQDLVNLLNDSFSSLTNVTVTLSGEDGEENQIILM